jgi:hypothetical protein
LLRMRKSRKEGSLYKYLDEIWNSKTNGDHAW